MKQIFKTCVSALLLSSILAGCAASTAPDSSSAQGLAPTQTQPSGNTDNTSTQTKAPNCDGLTDNQIEETHKFIRYNHLNIAEIEGLKMGIGIDMKRKGLDEAIKTCVINKTSTNLYNNYEDPIEKKLEKDLTCDFHKTLGDFIINAFNDVATNNPKLIEAHKFAMQHVFENMTPKRIAQLQQIKLTEDQKIIGLLPTGKKDIPPLSKEAALLMTSQLVDADQTKTIITAIRAYYKKTGCDANCMDKKMRGLSGKFKEEMKNIAIKVSKGIPFKKYIGDCKKANAPAETAKPDALKPAETD
jgi:hypothetical protein